MDLETKVAIIGAGPIGIELAIALKKHEISYVQFDKGQIGQIIYNYPVQTHFFSSSERIAIADIPIQTINQQKCTREEYLAYLRTCVMEHQISINTFEEVISIQKKAKGKFALETQSAAGKKLYHTSYIVFATGGTGISRMLNIPGEDLPQVLTQMGDPHLYFQKNISIIGSRNSAVEWSLRCFHAGAKVTLISRREVFDTEHVKYWLLPELKGLIKEGKINCIFSHRVVEILPNTIKISTQEGNVTEICSDFVIKAIGFLSDVSLLKKTGIAISENAIPSFNQETMETNIEDIFVMGTAIGGTQIRFKVFIENSHEHVQKITEALGKKLNKEIKFSKKNLFLSLPEQ